MLEKTYWSSLKSQLHEAILRADKELVEDLLIKGANANSRFEKGLTPLMVAANIGNIIIIQMLHDFGADSDLTDDQGKFADDYALSKETRVILDQFRSMKIFGSSIIWMDEHSNQK